MKQHVYAVFVLLFMNVVYAQQVKLAAALPEQKSNIVDCFKTDNQLTFLLEDNSITNYDLTTQALLVDNKSNSENFYKFKFNNSFKLNESRHNASYFCNDSDAYYCCISQGWSSRIIKLNIETNEETFICYLMGIPSGLVVEKNNI